MISLSINSTLLIGITIGIILFIVIVFVVVMYKDKKQNEEEIDEILSDLRKERKKEEVVKELESVIEKQTNSEELEEVSIEKVEDKENEIEKLLEKMGQDLKEEPKDAVINFEEEQEEKAIISYQELVKSIKGTDDSLKENVQEVESKELEKAIEQIEEKKENIEKDKKFKNTDFISPIYGKMKENLKYPTVPQFEKEEQINFEFDDEIVPSSMDSYLEDLDLTNNMEIDSLEKTLDMPPISSEIKKNDEFLNALKEFRKNLE